MSKYKSPTASELPPPSDDGAEDATWYWSPKLFIEFILLDALLTLDIEPATVFTLLIDPAVVLTFAIDPAVVFTFAILLAVVLTLAIALPTVLTLVILVATVSISDVLSF